MHKNKIKAEMFDKLHYLSSDYSDRMVHAELQYDFAINTEILKQVLDEFLEQSPVFHSSYIDNKLCSYWVVKPYRIEDVVHVETVNEEDLDSKIEAFLTGCIPADGDLQMRVNVFLQGGRSVLCILANHMCMDGGDFKYFLKALCQNYNARVKNPSSPVCFRRGARNYEQVYKDFSDADKRKAKRLYRNVNRTDRHLFPLTPPTVNDKAFIVRRKISADCFRKLKSAGKQHGATVNELLLAAYFRSLYELADWGSQERVSISNAIDLRRYMRDNGSLGLTNHTAWMQCAIPETGEDIFRTLQYVVHSSNTFKKDRFMGLHGLPLLSLVYKLPQAISEMIVKLGYANPHLAMSNMGILDAEQLTLEGHAPADGFMCGAVKYKPFVLLSVTTLCDEITLSMCVKGNQEDRKTVETFLNLMERNIGILSR